jgi:hypothetical protein
MSTELESRVRVSLILNPNHGAIVVTTFEDLDTSFIPMGSVELAYEITERKYPLANGAALRAPEVAEMTERMKRETAPKIEKGTYRSGN